MSAGIQGRTEWNIERSSMLAPAMDWNYGAPLDERKLPSPRYSGTSVAGMDGSSKVQQLLWTRGPDSGGAGRTLQRLQLLASHASDRPHSSRLKSETEQENISRVGEVQIQQVFDGAKPIRQRVPVNEYPARGSD